MDADGRDRIEREVRALWDARDFDGAATLAVRGYGPELYGFLVALHRDEEAASEVFSILGENLWRGLPSFAWGCTLRTWAYTIARHASLRYRKVEQRRARQGAPLSEHASALVAAVRTATNAFVKTEHKDRLARIRELLPAEDQVLLVLRLDRGLSWSDLARVTLDVVDPGEEALKRESARLRKRFQLVKDRLVELGRREGLLPGDEN
jgi:RNA polymerase sigma-70 factor (ECF subfamily)